MATKLPVYQFLAAREIKGGGEKRRDWYPENLCTQTGFYFHNYSPRGLSSIVVNGTETEAEGESERNWL